MDYHLHGALQQDVPAYEVCMKRRDTNSASIIALIHKDDVDELLNRIPAAHCEYYWGVKLEKAAQNASKASLYLDALTSGVFDQIVRRSNSHPHDVKQKLKIKQGSTNSRLRPDQVWT